jgi:hypothetical protein
LIGLAATLLMAGLGRVAGISGILGGLLAPRADNAGWQLAFLLGLVGGGALVALAAPSAIGASGLPWPVLLGAGFAVGLGTRLGNGCTSGHGVCGLSRFSQRSLVAVLTFMATGMLTATLLGGA